MDFVEEDASPLEFVVNTCASAYFDQVIGHIEDIVLSVEFEVLQNNFLEAHWQEFEFTEENKLEYMNIFQQYNSIFEQFFMQELSKRMPDFDMERFIEELNKDNAICQNNQRGEIFELINSFTDFPTFKDLMLDYRQRKEGKMQHLDFDILITKSMSDVLANEQSNKTQQKHLQENL